MLRVTRACRIQTLLLLLTLSTVFLFDYNRDHLYGSSRHPWDAEKNLAIAENLSSAHSFRLFIRRHLLVDGTSAYDLYGRFPIGGSVLIKLAIVPFDGLATKIAAARFLMLLLFSAAAVLAYHGTAQLTGSRWIALTATLLSFSSHHLLYYSDLIATEAIMDLCGVLWVFQGMVVFVKEGRFRQLVGKICVALLVGWHVYALLLAFVGLGVGKELLRSLRARAGKPIPERVGLLGALGIGLVDSRRYVLLGVVAVGFGTLVLGFNFTNEYTALGGEVAPADLPSVQSMRRRTGWEPSFDSDVARLLAWRRFLGNQFYGIGVMSLSYASALDNDRLIREVRRGSNWIGAAGILVTGACLAGMRLFRHRLLAAALVLSGFYWAVPMRYNTSVHEYERVFYVGIPLVFFSLVLLVVRHFWGQRPLAGLAVGAVGVFGVASFQMSQVAHPAQRTAVHRGVMTDFDVIRPIVEGQRVFVAFSRKEFGPLAGSRLALDFYLSGNTIAAPNIESLRAPNSPLFPGDVERRLEHVDFVVSRGRYGTARTLTPANRQVFLYAAADVRKHLMQKYQTVVVGTPVARNWFDLYLVDHRLTYVKVPCAPADVQGRFVLRVVPVATSALPVDEQTRGGAYWNFEWQAPLFEEKCMMTIPLPAYNLERVQTEQVVKGERMWTAEFAVREGDRERRGAPQAAWSRGIGDK